MNTEALRIYRRKAALAVCVSFAVSISSCSSSIGVSARHSNAPSVKVQPASSRGKGPSGSEASKQTSSVQGIQESTPSMPSPPPLSLPAKPDGKVPLSVSMSPTCVSAGEKIVMVVKTLPKTHMAFQPVYSDNASGAASPAGKGYGGDGKGISDTSGKFLWSWVISAKAPAGRTRMDVFAVTPHDWAYSFDFFTVKKGAVTC